MNSSHQVPSSVALKAQSSSGRTVSPGERTAALRDCRPSTGTAMTVSPGFTLTGSGVPRVSCGAGAVTRHTLSWPPDARPHAGESEGSPSGSGCSHTEPRGHIHPAAADILRRAAPVGTLSSESMETARLSSDGCLPPGTEAVVARRRNRPLTMLFIIVFIPVRSNPPGRAVP